MAQTISPKSIIITMIARVRSWLLNGITPKDVFGVQLTDHNNIFVADVAGNRKAKLLREVNGFTEFKIPVIFKPNLESKDSIAKQAEKFLLDKSPVYQEKLLDRSFKNMSKDNLKFVFGSPRKMITSARIDLDEVSSSTVVRVATKQLERQDVVELVEQPGDDKLEAYKAFNFVDIPQIVPTFTTWQLPFVAKRPVGFVNPDVLAILKADKMNGKQHLLRAYQVGRFDWEDVKDYLPSSFEISSRDFDEVEVESLVDAFIKAERRSAETQGKRLAKLAK
jgi:hypothetical protein